MIYVLSVKAVSKCKYTEKISIFARYCARNETYSSRMHIIELKQKKNMELPAKYDPALTEDKWYAYWLEHKFFHSEPDEREPYTIVIPPPNVTGILHMGHVLNNTLNDVLIRKARMDGKNAC